MPGSSGSTGGSSEVCSVWAIVEAVSNRRAFSTAAAARSARSSASARSCSSKRRPDSADTNEMTPSTWSRSVIGASIADRSPTVRISSRCSSSTAVCTSSSSGISR